MIKDNHIEPKPIADIHPLGFLSLQGKIDVVKKRRRISFGPIIDKDFMSRIKVINQIAAHVVVIVDGPL